MGLLESCVRDDLNRRAPRAWRSCDPVKVVLTNFPAGQAEQLPAANHPERPELGTRQLPFGREIWIERDDFMEEPPKKFFRLRPGGEVRLRFAYIIRCDEVVKDAAGRIVELRCSYDPATRSGTGPEAERKVKGTIHWVAAHAAHVADVRLYDRLFTVERPDADPAGRDFKDFLNPDSLQLRRECRLEPSLATWRLATGYSSSASATSSLIA